MWQQFPDLTVALLHLSRFPQHIDDDVMSYVESFVVRLYDKSSEITSVNASRHELFFHKGKDFKHMPPSKDALFQHTLRAAYQAGHIWGQTLISCPVLPDPSKWGWIKET